MHMRVKRAELLRTTMLADVTCTGHSHPLGPLNAPGLAGKQHHGRPAR